MWLLVIVDLLCSCLLYTSRAGKLAYGDELVREACFDHKTRCVFIAGDAGANAAKKAAFYAYKANVPCVTLPHGKLELGSAIGKAGCAMCAVADIGMAAAAVNKLAEQDPAYAEEMCIRDRFGIL